MGFLSRLRKVKVQFNPTHEDLVGGPEAAARLARQDLETRPLLGPAGEHVYGPDPRPAAGPPPRPVEVISPDRGAQAHHEWSQREADRAPYLAPGRAAVAFTRIATSRATAAADLAPGRPTRCHPRSRTSRARRRSS